MAQLKLSDHHVRHALRASVWILALAFSSWLMFHTFSYDGKTHEIRIAFKLWSDFGAHIPLIRSFSMGANWDRLIHLQTIEYPIYPGEPIRYHFIFDMIVGVLERMGLRIDWALNIPSIIGFAALLAGIYTLANRIFRSKVTGILATVFFLFNGSLGFLRFFQTKPLSWQSPLDIVGAKEFPAFAPWGPGDVTAFWNLNIYTNQRHLAIALAIVVWFIISMISSRQTSHAAAIKHGLLWGIVFGFFPYFHQPALLIVAVILVSYFLLFPSHRIRLFVTGLTSFFLAAPQLLMGATGAKSFEWYPGYVIHNELVKLPGIPHMVLRMGEFWWMNLGAHSVLMIVGWFFLTKQARKILFPIIPLFLIPNLFKFTQEAGANHKFFNFVMILGQMISAYTLVSLASWNLKDTAREIRIALSVGRTLVLVSLVGLLTLSGVIDFFVIKNDTIGSLKDIPASPAALWIADHTTPDAIFFNSSYLYHPASVAGRAIFLGWPYFAWSAGYVGNRFDELKKIYESKDPDVMCPFFRRYHISYFTVEDTQGDTNLPRIDVSYYFSRLSPLFTNDDKSYGIFSVSSLCETAR